MHGYHYINSTARSLHHRHIFKSKHYLKADELVEVRSWCIEQFGAPGIFDTPCRWSCSKKTHEAHGEYGYSYGPNHTGKATFVFRDDHDAFAFRMRWC